MAFRSLRNPPPEKPPKPKPTQRQLLNDEQRAKRIEVEVMKPAPVPSIISKDEWQAIYFAALEANGGQIRKATEKAGVTSATIWRNRNEDHDFARDEIEALKRAKSTVEDEARRRAIDGVVTHRIVKPNGEVAEKIEYSDTLLLRLLEKTESGSWLRREQKAEVQGIQFATRAERKAAIERARKESAASQAKLGERPLSYYSENEESKESFTEKEP